MQLKRDFNHRLKQIEQEYEEKLEHKGVAIEKAQAVITTLTIELEKCS